MSGPKKTVQAPLAASKTVTLEATVIEHLNKFRPHYKQAGIGIACVAALGICLALVAAGKRNKIADAYALLREATSLDLMATDLSAEQRTTREAEKREKLDTVISDYASTPAAVDAKFQLAKLAFDAGAYSQAAEAFKSFYTEYPDTPPLTTMAYFGEANSFMSQNDFTGAISKFQALAANEKLQKRDPQAVQQAKYQIALAGFVSGNYDQAKSVLTEILPSTTNEQLTEKVQSLLGKLKIIPPEDVKLALNKATSRSAQGITVGSAVPAAAPAPVSTTEPKSEGSASGETEGSGTAEGSTTK